MSRTRLPRHLHPGAWWLWAIGLATAASRTENPVLLLVICAVAGYVVVARRSSAPWARAYAVFLRLGLIVVGVRVLLSILFAAEIPGHVLVRLPSIGLPHWAAGLRIGGAVTAEQLAGAAYDGLRLATLLICVGAANALASPGRLLRALPGALYEAGVAVTVALTFAPQAVVTAGRVRAARRLRGRPDRGLGALRGLALPVLEGALDRSVTLAAAMDARGFGRRGATPRRTRTVTATVTVAGLLAILGGLYGLLDVGTPGLLRLPLLVVGCALAAAGLALGSRRAGRTRHRPDPWSWPEWAVTACGVATAAAVIVTGHLDATGLYPSTSPLVAPALPAVALAGLLVALGPAWLAPPVPRERRAPVAMKALAA